jgi:uncharacterized protein (UPF0332 family)
MNGRDFLSVADDLAAGLTEAEWRSAVSRAYYAAFHVARDLLSQCGFDVPRVEAAHAYLWLRLTNAGHPDVQYAGLDLRHLRIARNRADYDLDLPFTQASAFAQAQTAADIIQLLEAVGADTVVRTRLTDAIKIYERDVLGEVTWRP